MSDTEAAMDEPVVIGTSSLADVRSTVTGNTVMLHNLIDQFAKMSANISAVQADVSNLQSENGALKTQISTLKDENVRLTQEIFILSEQGKHSLVKIGQLEAEIGSKDTAISNLEAKVAHKESMVQEKTEEIRQLEDTLTLAQKESLESIKKVKDECLEIIGKNNDLLAAESEASKKIADRDSQINIQSQLARDFEHKNAILLESIQQRDRDVSELREMGALAAGGVVAVTATEAIVSALGSKCLLAVVGIGALSALPPVAAAVISGVVVAVALGACYGLFRIGRHYWRRRKLNKGYEKVPHQD